MINLKKIKDGECLSLVYEIDIEYENDYVGINVYKDCKKETLKDSSLKGLPILRGEHIKTYAPKGYFVPELPKDYSKGLVIIREKYKCEGKFLSTNLNEIIVRYNELLNSKINECLKEASLFNKEKNEMLVRLLEEEQS